MSDKRPQSRQDGIHLNPSFRAASALKAQEAYLRYHSPFIGYPFYPGGRGLVVAALAVPTLRCLVHVITVPVIGSGEFSSGSNPEVDPNPHPDFWVESVNGCIYTPTFLRVAWRLAQWTQRNPLGPTVDSPNQVVVKWANNIVYHHPGILIVAIFLVASLMGLTQ